MTRYIKEQTSFAGHSQGSTFKQTQNTIVTDLRKSTEPNIQYNNLHSQNWTKSCEKIQNSIIESIPNLVNQKL